MDAKSRLFQREFPNRVREYLTTTATVRETDADGKPGAVVAGAALSENTFYKLDGDSLLALSHAVEDLALEAAEGQFVAFLQEDGNFEAHRERYGQLAVTLAETQVVVSNGKISRMRGLKVVIDKHGYTSPFWVTLYQGNKNHALVAAREIAPAACFEDKTFIGCFSFNPQVIARFREDLGEMVAGRRKTLEEFERMEAIDHAAKQIKAEFARQNDTLAQAMQKLMLGKKSFHSAEISHELAKGLSRLEQWKARLPQILERPERP